jgi:sorting nexin-25
MLAYELPGKLISGIMKKRSAFMDSRRESLEKYIMQLLAHPEICKVQVFRRFICHPEIIRLLYGDSLGDESPNKKNFLRNVVYSVDDTMDTMFQRRNQRNTNFSTEKTAVQTSVFSHNPVSREFIAKKEEGEAVSSTAEPILDLFVELFELKGLRRQAVVILIQNLFGDTVERKVTEGLRDSLAQEKMIAVVNTICDSFWPNGEWSSLVVPRTEDQKVRTKFEASGKITQLFPEIFGGIVGRQTARKGAVRVCTALQNPRLNQHLMYKILDEILNALFP